MAGAGALTAVALNALFGVCVPGVSQGKLEQSFPTAQIVPLTDEEKKTYADAIKDDDRAYHIMSETGFILMTTKGGFCRIITSEGDTGDAAAQFRTRLGAAGGSEHSLGSPEPGDEAVDGVIPLGGGDIVAVVFTATRNSNSGFFASAFGAHKDQP